MAVDAPDMVRLVGMLVAHEGLRLKPYKCPAGKLTIGVGRNLDDRGITEEEALWLLQDDIREAVSGLERAVPCWPRLSARRKEVLVDMTINMGLRGVRGFARMLDALAVGRYEDAASEMLASKWAKQVGRRAVELAQIMREG